MLRTAADGVYLTLLGLLGLGLGAALRSSAESRLTEWGKGTTVVADRRTRW
ncbi:hypothetical protein [Streptomyces sp. NPDC002758]